ncbi:MAG: hypothetical protein K6V73_11375 [Firmicutes bacterium]|nr:hypothetical protein [Bacillota bacterium]
MVAQAAMGRPLRVSEGFRWGVGELAVAARDDAVCVEAEIDVGWRDPEEEALAYSLRHPLFRGRLAVRARTHPTRSRERSVPLLAWFDVRGPGRVRWAFARVGEDE